MPVDPRARSGVYALQQVVSDPLAAGSVTAAMLAVGAAAANLGSPVWTALSYGTGWANYTAAGGALAGWWKDPLGRVWLRGLILRTGTPSPPETMFTLPAGARPVGLEALLGIGGSASAVISYNVLTSGVAQIQATPTPSAGAYLSLAGMSFSTL